MFVYTQGDWVWLPDSKLGYVPAKFISEENFRIQFENAFGAKVVVPAEDKFRRLPSVTAVNFFQACSDLVDLRDFSEGRWGNRQR